jgi:hypothetical protein
VSANSESTPPRGYILIEEAARLLTEGGTHRTLLAAAAFLGHLADVQGTTRDGIIPVPTLHWWQACWGAPLYVYMHDVPNLREEFGLRIAGLVPADEWTAPMATVVESKATASPTYRERGNAECYEHLLKLMQSGPPTKGQDKSTMRRILTARFKISGNSFDDSWSRALDDADARKTWGKAGSRPKSRPNHDA